VTWRIDYSDQKLATLNEAHQDENLGINAGTNDITAHRCPNSQDFRFPPATGPIDWNCDGKIESNVHRADSYGR